MPQTRQNKAVTPIPSDEYNLTQDLATFADSLNVPVVVNSSTERNALDPYEGLTVIRLDLGGVQQSYVSGAWRSNYVAPYRQWYATTTFSLTGEGGAWWVPLPAGLFTVPPLVFVTKANNIGAGYIPYAIDDQHTTSQVRIGAYWNNNTIPYTVKLSLHCVQARPGSAGGLIIP